MHRNECACIAMHAYTFWVLLHRIQESVGFFFGRKRFYENGAVFDNRLLSFLGTQPLSRHCAVDMERLGRIQLVNIVFVTSYSSRPRARSVCWPVHKLIVNPILVCYNRSLVSHSIIYLIFPASIRGRSLAPNFSVRPLASRQPLLYVSWFMLYDMRALPAHALSSSCLWEL